MSKAIMVDAGSGADVTVAARGRFLSFEGVDGAGKSTLLRRLHAHLQSRRVDLLMTREPGGTALGEALRATLLGSPMDSLTETLLMYASRRQHVVEVIAPALAAGRWVLCDRFLDASHAYQGGGRGVPDSVLVTLDHLVAPDLMPDLTVLVDLDPERAQARRAAARGADRFEAEDCDFFSKVRAAYLRRAEQEPARFLILNGQLDPDTLEAALLSHVDGLPW
jgi:dTMP kinase